MWPASMSNMEHIHVGRTWICSRPRPFAGVVYPFAPSLLDPAMSRVRASSLPSQASLMHLRGDLRGTSARFKAPISRG